MVDGYVFDCVNMHKNAAFCLLCSVLSVERDSKLASTTVLMIELLLYSSSSDSIHFCCCQCWWSEWHTRA